MSFEARLQALLDAQAEEIKEEIARVRRAADDLVATFEAQIERIKKQAERGPTVEETLAEQIATKGHCPDCGEIKWPEHICPAKPIFKGNKESSRPTPVVEEEPAPPALPPGAAAIVMDMRSQLDESAIHANMNAWRQ